jgi:hypothetical protein
MRPALDPTGHRVPRMKPTCLLHTWRPHRQRPFVLVLHLHQHESNRNLHLQYLAKNQSTQRRQSLITQGSDHPPVLEPHMVLNLPPRMSCLNHYSNHPCKHIFSFAIFLATCRCFPRMKLWPGTRLWPTSATPAAARRRLRRARRHRAARTLGQLLDRTPTAQNWSVAGQTDPITVSRGPFVTETLIFLLLHADPPTSKKSCSSVLNFTV